MDNSPEKDILDPRFLQAKGKLDQLMAGVSQPTSEDERVAYGRIKSHIRVLIAGFPSNQDLENATFQDLCRSLVQGTSVREDEMVNATQGVNLNGKPWDVLDSLGTLKDLNNPINRASEEKQRKFSKDSKKLLAQLANAN